MKNVHKGVILAVGTGVALIAVVTFYIYFVASIFGGKSPGEIVRQPETPTSTDQIIEEDKSDMIQVFAPTRSQAVSSPLEVRGQARGTWFFEGSFPVKIYDDNGTLLGTAIASTTEDWMTEDFVPFGANLVFEDPDTATGVLVLEKDNPSGMEELDDELRFPVNFAISNGIAINSFEDCVEAGFPVMESYPRQCRTDDGRTFVEEISARDECRPTGCSGQICADEEVASTCEYLPHYQCYDLTTCERQPNGECGWTETEEFTECLEEYR